MNAAAEWLLKNGWAELEKMQENVLKISARDAEREMEESAGLQRGNSDEELDDDDDDNLWLVQQADRPARDANRDTGERWLDEDLEQTVSCIDSLESWREFFQISEIFFTENSLRNFSSKY